MSIDDPMITIDDFEYVFKYHPRQPRRWTVDVTFLPEREAWTIAVHTGVYHHWIDIKNECIGVLSKWMTEHNINSRQSTFLNGDTTEITIEDLESYIYMKMALGGNNG